jgi:uncharacterized Zn finger protein
MYHEWRRYVPAAARRRRAAREMQRVGKTGHASSPVRLAGRTIANTFWGKAWCDNLERYSDFSNRLPRGRSYLRNGSVVDLQIAPGEVSARVIGSRMYQVAVQVAAVPRTRWTLVCADCAGAIDSLVELLQGRFSKGVMERLCRQKDGLFPAPAEIRFSCSCPDWASMCKHVAAVLYGIGARLDAEPQLLFTLRKVHEDELIARAGSGAPLSRREPTTGRVLAGASLSELFGLDLGSDNDGASATSSAGPVNLPAKAAKRRSTKRKAARSRTRRSKAKKH